MVQKMGVHELHMSLLPTVKINRVEYERLQTLSVSLQTRSVRQQSTILSCPQLVVHLMIGGLMLTIMVNETETCQDGERLAKAKRKAIWVCDLNVDGKKM